MPPMEVCVPISFDTLVKTNVCPQGFLLISPNVGCFGNNMNTNGKKHHANSIEKTTTIN